MSAPDVTVAPVAPHTSSGKRSASLDGLRGFAALAIFAFHGWLYTMPEPNATDRSSVFEFAVHELRLALVAFFVLSGFLLFRPWISAVFDKGAPPDMRRYVRARVARVLPGYYVALVGSIALLWGLAGTPGLRLPPAEQLPLFLVFGQNFSAATVMKLNPPMWSLAVEVMFYALLPLVGWLALRLPPRPRMQALVPLALLAIGMLYNWSIAGHGLGMTFSKTLAAMLPYFALGMLAALLLHRRSIDLRAKRMLIGGGAVLIVIDGIAKGAAPANGIDATTAFSVLRDLPSGVGFALIVCALAAAPQGRLLGGRALVALGTISYGFYLWHVPVLMVLRGHGLLPLDPFLGSAVAFLPSLALAALSWFACERPVLRWSARRDRRKALEAEARLRSRGVDRAGGRELAGREVSTVRA